MQDRREQIVELRTQLAAIETKADELGLDTLGFLIAMARAELETHLSSPSLTNLGQTAEDN